MTLNWEPSKRFGEWQGCIGCAHYRHGKCAAYPAGIPLLILSGEVDHMVKRPGQVNDTVFEPMDFDVWRRTRQRVSVQSPARVAPRRPS